MQHGCLAEPENAHSHLLSMMLGNSESIPVTGGKLAIGVWQSRPLQPVQLILNACTANSHNTTPCRFQLMGRT
eukprot:1145678-Pelagomonas_calceolata.AAC.3